MDKPNSPDIPTGPALPETAEAALADLRHRYGRCYTFEAFYVLRWTATRRDADDMSPFLDEGSSEELLAAIRSEYALRHDTEPATEAGPWNP